MNLIKEFEKVRDIPYRIPLFTDEPDECCTGKTKTLVDVFKQNGYDARYRICTFRWSDLSLPSNVSSVPHDDNSSHMFTEIKIDGQWKIADATWDKGLKNIFHINDWDGKSNTEIAVPVIKLLSPEEGVEYQNHISTPEAVAKDFEVNREFYQAFNEWLEEERNNKTKD